MSVSLPFTQVLIEVLPSSLVHLRVSDTFFCQISPSLFINHELLVRLDAAE